MSTLLHIPEPLEGVAVYPLLEFLYAQDKKADSVFVGPAQPNFFESVELVSPQGAQAIVLPNNFKKDSPHVQAYVTQYADMAESLGVPIFIFSCGDFTDTLRFDVRVFVFRYSLYRSRKSPRDIAIPTLADDLGTAGVVLREKRTLPVVSFCGQGGYHTTLQWIKYALKVAYFRVWGLFDPPQRARTLGVYWRRAMMRACAASAEVDTHFIVRKSFSGHRGTIELDAAQARSEFRESIVESDFVLAPKGDGNYSNRFLEALSLGRILVVPDTDLVLPAQDDIDYSKIMVRIPMGQLERTPHYIRAFYDPLTPQEWLQRQTLAAEVYKRFLSQQGFWKQFFNTTLPDKI